MFGIRFTRYGESSMLGWCRNDYTEEIKTFPSKRMAASYAELSHHRNYEVFPL